jgi:DNA-binding transcriptional ArsR family regulator
MERSLMVKKQISTEYSEILDEITYNTPEVVSSLFHKKKQLILKKLIKKEMTIYDLKTNLNMNPGEIRRHILDLLDKGLIVQTKVVRNKMGMNLKYYRAKAKNYIVRLSWGIQA